MFREKCPTSRRRTFPRNIEIIVSIPTDRSFARPQLLRDSYWLPSDHNIFSNWRLNRIAAMNDDIAKCGYDSMQQIIKTYEKYLTKNLEGEAFNL